MKVLLNQIFISLPNWFKRENLFHTITQFNDDSQKIPTPVGTAREGNGTPLQYSCLENPMDRGAW